MNVQRILFHKIYHLTMTLLLGKMTIEEGTADRWLAH